MIELIKRQTVFEKYKNITAELSELQAAYFDNDPDSFEDEVHQQEYHQLFDIKNFDCIKPEKTYSIFSLNHSEINSFASVLSSKIVALLTDLDVIQLIMISHLKMSFVNNLENTYPPFMSSLRNFEKITGDLTYREALITDLEGLPQLLEIAFWFGRCDGGAPEFLFFHDVDEKLAFSICKEGNVHIVEFDNKLLNSNTLAKNGLEVLLGPCLNKFSEESDIEGRLIQL